MTLTKLVSGSALQMSTVYGKGLFNASSFVWCLATPADMRHGESPTWSI